MPLSRSGRLRRVRLAARRPGPPARAQGRGGPRAARPAGALERRGRGRGGARGRRRPGLAHPRRVRRRPRRPGRPAPAPLARRRARRHLPHRHARRDLARRHRAHLARRAGRRRRRPLGRRPGRRAGAVRGGPGVTDGSSPTGRGRTASTGSSTSSPCPPVASGRSTPVPRRPSSPPPCGPRGRPGDRPSTCMRAWGCSRPRSPTRSARAATSWRSRPTGTPSPRHHRPRGPGQRGRARCPGRRRVRPGPRRPPARPGPPPGTLTAAAPRADLVVLDPPRTGAGPAVVAGIAGLRPRAVAYVACDPAALARDTAALISQGTGSRRCAPSTPSR